MARLFKHLLTISDNEHNLVNHIINSCLSRNGMKFAIDEEYCLMNASIGVINCIRPLAMPMMVQKYDS